MRVVFVAIPRVVDIDPQTRALFFLERISLQVAQQKVPFDPTLSASHPPHLVEHQGRLYIFNGNHRLYAIRMLDPAPPATIQVYLFTVDEFAAYTGLSRQDLLGYIGSALQQPVLGP